MRNKDHQLYKGLFCISVFMITCLNSSFKTDYFKDVKVNRDVLSVRKTLDSLYGAFSFKSGQEPAWNTIRHLTLNGAAFVSAPSNNAKRFAINIEEFIQDYKSDIIKSDLKKTGYSEHIISADIRKSGNVATADVIFKAFIKGDKRIRRPGMDNIQLLLYHGALKVVAFTTQSESTPQ